MDNAGTITANLATRSNGGNGHAQRISAPSNPDYARWLAHLHGLQPGQVKAIPCLEQKSYVADRFPPFVSELPWILGLILTALAVNYRHTYWGSFALREFDIRRIPFELEVDYQKRRGNVRIFVAAVLALGAYVAAVKQSQRPAGGGSTLLFFIALCCVYFGIWSLVAGIKIRLMAKRLS